MKLADTTESYGLISRLNHWLVAAIVIAMLGVGLYFSQLPKGDERLYWLQMHIAIGSIAFVFIAFRILWRAISRRTQPFPQGRAMQVTTNFVHGVLMVGLTLMIITGPLMVWTKGVEIAPFGLFSLPSPTGKMPQLHEVLEQIHVRMAYVVLVALVIHVVGTFKHILFERQILVGRMIGSVKADAATARG